MVQFVHGEGLLLALYLPMDEVFFEVLANVVEG